MNLSDGIDQYLADRRSKGMKPGTVRGEAITLRLLLADVGNIDLRRLTIQHLDLFWSRRTKWQPSTMNKARAHLSAFFQWCQARKYIAGDTVLLDKRKFRESERTVIIIPQAEFEPFLEGIAEPRTRAMCAIGLYAFFGIAETSKLRIQDVNFYDHKITTVREKTGELLDVPLVTELERELKRWFLEYGSQIGRPLRPSDYVIPGYKQGTYRGRKGLNGFEQVGASSYMPDQKAHLSWSINQALRSAGYYEKGEGGHTLRRSGGIALYGRLTHLGHDRSMRVIQAMYGHSSIATTEHYLKLSLDKKLTHDLLAGQPMFAESEVADVISLRVGDHPTGHGLENFATAQD